MRTRRVRIDGTSTRSLARSERVEGHTAGRVISGDLTYHQAQTEEARIAKRDGCVHGAGGEYKAGRVWSVYKVSGGRTS